MNNAKQRNSYVLFFEDNALIIDPGGKTVDSIYYYIKECTYILNINIYILVSHVHTNHYDGIEKLINFLSKNKTNVFIISPFDLHFDMVNCTMIVLNSNSKFKLNKSNIAITISNILGHCNEMLELKIFDISQNRIFLFSSDNITTNFIPPITNEGGDVKEIIKYYENTLTLLEDFEEIYLLPGHGDVRRGKNHIRKLINYFNSLPECKFQDIDNSLIDKTSIQLAQNFHKLNVSKA